MGHNQGNTSFPLLSPTESDASLRLKNKQAAKKEMISSFASKRKSGDCRDLLEQALQGWVPNRRSKQQSWDKCSSYVIVEKGGSKRVHLMALVFHSEPSHVQWTPPEPHPSQLCQVISVTISSLWPKQIKTHQQLQITVGHRTYSPVSQMANPQ